MRKLMLVAATLALALVWSAMPAAAQDIYGLSFRPTDALPEMAARGLVDITADGEDFLVSIDLSGAADSLDLDDFDDAEAFVAWAVDMDGEVNRLGTLDEDLVLEDALIAAVVAKVFLTAEADAEVDAPTGERLYEVTLRNVAEAESQAAGDEDADTEEDDAATEGEDEAAKDDEADEGEEEESGKPEVLPTTGNPSQDLLVLALVALGLLAGAARLRTIRL